MIESIQILTDNSLSTNQNGIFQKFMFSKCFNEDTSQKDLFDKIQIQKNLDMALEGEISTVFVYGQTGSGKTHT
jgi:Cdc6-like AAA superfamily ATPase